MATTNTALGKAIAGLQRDYRNSNNWAGLAIAPYVKGGTNGQIQVMTTDGRYDARDANPSVAYGGQHRQLRMELSKIPYALELYDLGGIPLDQRMIEALESANPELDLVDSAVQMIMDNGYAAWLTGFSTAAAGLTDVGSALDLSVPNGGVLEYFLDARDAIHASTGKRPTHVYVGQEAASKLMLQDDIQGTTAIAGDTGTNARRTGSVSMPMVYDWFKSRLNLELVVEEHAGILVSGVAGFSLTTAGFLGYCAPGTQMSTLKTIVSDPNAEVVRIHTRDLAYPSRPGVGVSGDAEFQVLATTPATGRKFTITL